SNISTDSYDDTGLAKPKSMYQEIFQNSAANKPNVGDTDHFILNSTKTELQEFSVGKKMNILSEPVLSTIMGSFVINKSEVDLLVNDSSGQDKDILNLKNLSTMYRKVSLARELDLSIQEFLQIRDLTGINPFVSDNNPAPSSLHTTDTLR